MIWTNLTALSNYDIIAIIEGINSGAVDFTFDDLKRLQTELINRRMETRYMTLVGEIMRKMIEKEEEKAATAVAAIPEPVSIPEPEPEIPRPRRQVPFEEEYVEPPRPVRIEEAEEARPTRRDFSERIATVRHTPPVRPIKKPTVAEIFDESDYEEDSPENAFPALKILVVLYKILGWILVGGSVAGFVVFSVFYAQGNMLFLAAALGVTILAGLLWIFISYALAESVSLKLETLKLLAKKQG